MIQQNPPVRRPSAAPGIREARVVGDAQRVGEVVDMLKDRDLFVGASAMRFDPNVGSFAVVRYLDRTASQRPAPSAPARRVPALQVSAARALPPAPSHRKLVIGAVVGAVALLLCGGAVMWVRRLLSGITSADVATAVGALGVAILVLVAVLRAAGGGSGHGSGYGLHWTRCK